MSNKMENPRISVRDNGQGIEKENLAQIFVPFYSTKKNGSGIGLSLSRQIMKLHKGRIEVESEKGKGSCFTLEF
jgi:signal transduction histidine kinase